MSEELQLDHNLAPGTWRPELWYGPGSEYKLFAIIRCRDCRKVLSIFNHTIADDGQVSPSVGHPTSYPACGWHPTPRLIGWTPNVLAPQKITTCAKCGCVTRILGGWGTWNGPGLLCPGCIKRGPALREAGVEVIRDA